MPNVDGRPERPGHDQIGRQGDFLRSDRREGRIGKAETFEGELEKGGPAPLWFDEDNPRVRACDGDRDTRQSRSRPQVGYQAILRHKTIQGAQGVQDVTFPDAPKVRIGDESEPGGVLAEKTLEPPQGRPSFGG